MDKVLCTQFTALPLQRLTKGTPLLLRSPTSTSTSSNFISRSASQSSSSTEGDDAPQSQPAVAGTGTAEIQLSSVLDSPAASLINYANIQRSFSGEALLTRDHYSTLDLTPSSSYEEVTSAFKKRKESILQQGLNEVEIQNELRTIKASFDILSSEEERRLYDWSLFHSQSPGAVYRWPYEADITQSKYPEAPAKEPENDEGVRKVAYFFLGWFVLACILNVVLR